MTGISLACGDFRLEVVPQLGAAVAAFTCRGHHVLRPARRGTDNPFETSSFALVPYANRIAGGAFRFAGRDVLIPRNAPDQAHPLHGDAWRHPWNIRETGERHTVLTFEHERDSWPWRYRAEQTLTLNDSGLVVDLSLRNTDSLPMPAGLGWHPYFPLSADVELRAQVLGAWLSNGECLPTDHITDSRLGDWSRGEVVERATLVDNCHTGWTGPALIRYPREGLELSMAASGALRWLHIYIPPGRDFFCVEPVSHMPDAVNRAEPATETGLEVLEPGARFDAHISLHVKAPD
jgi:aldose 1-epimerase